MGCLRPATPGFLVTLIATVLLAVVSFCVPYFKSVYFLKANISIHGFNGSITFGTLGYCLELSNGTTCSSPSVGYQLDINGLVGNHLPVEIPQVAVKWLTYALVLHIVALGLSAVSTGFGLLAHVREMSMTCCSSFVSGFAATVALVAFIFDVTLFFIARARIRAVGSAQIGNAIWLTLAAWVLLFFSGCFFSIGRCCISRRPRGGDGWGGQKGNNYEDQMRLDAVKAEAERKALQKTEVGLPIFHEVQPLTGRVDGDAVYTDDPYKGSRDGTIASSHSTQNTRPDGYAPAPDGTRAVEEYYMPSNTSPYQPAQHDPRGQYNGTAFAAPSAYPPGIPSPPPQHQAYPSTGYASTPYQSLPPSSPGLGNQYLAVTPQSYADPYSGATQAYGHASQDPSYHSAIHQQQPTAYSQYDDPYASTTAQPQASYHYDSNPARYTTSPPLATTSYPAANTGSYFTSPAAPEHERSYTLGGDGYGEPSFPSHVQTGAVYQSPIPTAITTDGAYASPPPTSPLRGPRPQASASSALHHEEAPPGYETGTSNITGAWGKH
ncbi:hypothetical protein AX17_000767 [Amanita inopinata Kibby_2008]|nr:hypothetical protein AX17_000767 [Amanita inopinata Kibby_2008]